VGATVGATVQNALLLRRLASHIAKPTRMVTTMALAMTGALLLETNQSPLAIVTRLTTETPPTKGTSKGMAQQAAHAPATPRAANTSFFILSHLDELETIPLNLM